MIAPYHRHHRWRVLLTMAVSLALGACSTVTPASVQVAPPIGSNDRVEPLGFDRYELSSAVPQATFPDQPNPSTTVRSAAIPPQAPPTIPPTLPPTLPPQAPPTVPATVGTAPAPRTSRVATTEPAPPRTATSVAPPPTAATSVAPAVAEPLPTTTAPAAPAAPGTAGPAVASVIPPVAARCTRADQNRSRTRADGSVVGCRRRNGVRTWVLLSGPTGTGRAPVPPPTAPGFDGSTIRVGVLSTTTHPVWGTIGRALKAGLEARVATINRQGGISGRYRIELVFAETNYDAVQTAAQLTATSDHVAAYAQILGTPNVEAVEPLLRRLQLVASPASQEARWATSPNLLPIGNSYQIQAVNGISYFLQQSALANPGLTQRVCAASVATSYGDAGSEGLRFAQERLGFDAGPIVSVGAAETGMSAYAGQLRNAGCTAVLVTVGPAQTLGLVVSGRQLGFSPRWIITGASFSDKIVTPQTGPLLEQGAWVVGDGTQWGDPSVPGMATIRNELLAADHRFWTENPDVGLTYGYTQGRVIEAVLEKAVSRGDLSRVGILSASHAIGRVDTLGLMSPVDYSQAVRLADARTTVFAVDGSFPNAINVLARDYSSPAALAYRKEPVA